MHIRTKLYLLMAISIAGLLLAGGAGLFGMSKARGALTELGTNQMPSIVGLTEMTRAQLEVRVANREILLASSEEPSKVLHWLDVKRDAYARFMKGRGIYEPLPQTKDEAQVWASLVPDLARWKEGNEAIDRVVADIGASSSIDQRKALVARMKEMLTELQPPAQAATQKLDKVVDINVQAGSDYYAQSSQAIAQANWEIVAVGGIALLVILGLATYLSNSIMRPLLAMRGTIKTIEERNDFTQRVAVVSNDEIGETVQAFNRLLTKTQKSLSEVLAGVSVVESATHTLATASQQVAASSTHQSDAAAAMAASVEEVTVSIAHVSTNAKEALSLSQGAGSIAAEGGRVIHKTVDEMSKISEHVEHTASAINTLGEQSKEITSIVNVIKEVADQTNLLALNAAIEAARAGETGRGFAVVADEVRKLAERTSKSTAEISLMIGQIQNSTDDAVASMAAVVTRVTEGRTLVEQAGGYVSQIQESAARVVVAVTDITDALHEQSTASESIALSVESVAQMSDENSMSAQQTSESAVILENLAHQMHETVTQFKV